MNPICLLTPARTYKEMADRPGAYKLLAQTAPVKRPGKRGGARQAPVVPEMEQKSLFERMPEPVEAVEPEEPALVAVAVPVLRESEPVIPVEEAKVVEESKREEREKTPTANPFAKAQSTPAHRAATVCKEWLGHLAFWRKGRPNGRATVQGELALEKVTVLHNDLNEDDLEVVLVERKVGTGEKPLARFSKVEIPTEAWTWLTAAFHKKTGESASNPKEEAATPSELNARA
jgi:hypothetical protein